MDRVDLALPGAAARPLTDYELASRLSHFLWSSVPDKELLAHAAAGGLHRPKMLIEQTRRMLKDPRADRLATEFGGNWLGVRRFQSHNGVNRDRSAAGLREGLRTRLGVDLPVIISDSFGRAWRHGQSEVAIGCQ